MNILHLSADRHNHAGFRSHLILRSSRQPKIPTCMLTANQAWQMAQPSRSRNLELLKSKFHRTKTRNLLLKIRQGRTCYGDSAPARRRLSTTSTSSSTSSPGNGQPCRAGSRARRPRCPRTQSCRGLTRRRPRDPTSWATSSHENGPRGQARGSGALTITRTR